jgi:hypothetical protein
MSNSPIGGRRSPFDRPSRSATAPIQRPPSPELLSTNLDCAFPPFPTKPLPPRPQQAGGLGSYTAADPMYAPMSPRTATSGGLLQRMNTIAPGPFDVNRRQRSENKQAGKGHQRQATEGSLKNMTMSSRTDEVGSSIIRPSTAIPGHSRTMTTSSIESGSGVTPPTVPRKNDYGGFGPPAGDDTYIAPLRPENRSQTFPIRAPAQPAPSRTPLQPNPGAKSSRERRKPSGPGPDLSRPLPPRGASLIRPRINTQNGEVPPIPDNINLAEEFGIGNPYHTPTESQSSDNSGYSEESKASSRSSPPRSIKSERSRRQPSDTTRVDVLMSEIESSMTDLQQKEPPSNQSPQKLSPINNIRGQYARPPMPQQNLSDSMLAPESPMDPIMQGGCLSPDSRNPRSESARPSNPSNPHERHIRRPTSSRGNCKGCRQPIKGKSISSADGRLTGRYHKQCFVCKTCSEPFQTADFYVIDDAPYCERHYHKLNGSICTTCDRGIEGQYLETERKQKYHHGCFNCADCKRSMKHDYFEMNGHVYCERDAFRRAQQGRFLGPGGQTNRMERRTTRMMRMG